MREFIWAALQLLLVLLNIITSSFVDAAGKVQNASSSSKSVDSPVKKGSLADLIAMERTKEQDRYEELAEFVHELRENEHLIGAVFPSQQPFKQVQTQKEEKGMLHTIFKILGEKEDKKTALEQKYQNLKGIKQNDPALSQIMEKLLSYNEKIKSERILKPHLKEYLYFTIQFVAKRQRIPLSGIVPFKQMDKKLSFSKLVKLFLEEKLKRHRKGQNGDKHGQKSNSKKDKSSEKSKQEKTLRLLLTAMDDGNDIGNLAMNFNKQKSRRKKRFISLIIFILIMFIISTLIHFCQLNPLRQTQKIGKSTQNKILEAFHELTEQNAPIEAPEGEEKPECAVCLGNFEAGDKVRPLPPCEHIFHTECIELWLKQHNNCPMCRAEIFKISSGKVKPNVKEAPNAEARLNTENAVENV
uniref:RING-type domain-containing protein n=1 Tax=Globodera rostochiensis TaxID=31243 RepID=A0A914HME8_GLORO